MKAMNLDTLSDINKRIETEYCPKTEKQLSDKNLYDDYKKSKSVLERRKVISGVLSKHNLNTETKEKIIQDLSLLLIPAGTKGIIRGKKFNGIIENLIKSFKLNKDNFDVCFEKNCEKHITNEIPDWYILEKKTGKIIIGMNQLDLWGGGHQINRGFKYIINNPNNSENSKLLCVVCNKIQLKSKKNKIFKLFKVGFEKNTLCYLNNLQNIIYSYFCLK